MTDTNSTTLRNALAAAVKNHVEANALSAKDGAELADVQLSRFYQVLRGEVGKISSDALVNMLGNFGYRLTGINGSGDGTEIVLSLDKAEKVLPEIESPISIEVAERLKEEVDAVRLQADSFSVVSDSSAEPFKVVEGSAEFDPDFDRVVSEDE